MFWFAFLSGSCPIVICSVWPITIIWSVWSGSHSHFCHFNLVHSIARPNRSSQCHYFGLLPLIMTKFSLFGEAHTFLQSDYEKKHLFWNLSVGIIKESWRSSEYSSQDLAWFCFAWPRVNKVCSVLLRVIKLSVCPPRHRNNSPRYG